MLLRCITKLVLAFGGTVKEGEEHMIQSKKLQKLFEGMVRRKTKITAKKHKDIYEHKIDWYMNSKEAKKLGVIDQII